LFSNIKKGGKWSKYIKSILDDIELGDLYETMAQANTNLCKEMLINEFQTDWDNLVKRKPKLRTYARIKTNFEVEKYVLLNLDRHQRSNLAQLRCGILPLQVELGRFNNVKLEDRLCQLCNNNVIEDEIHFLFHCPAYQEVRAHFIHDVGGNIELQNDWEKLITLFKTNVRKLAKFVCKLTYLRQTKLYV